LGERLVRRSELFQRKEYTDACPWKKRGIVGIRDFFAACRAGTFDPAAPGVTDKRLNESADAEPDILISRCGFGEPAAISREEALCVPFSFFFSFSVFSPRYAYVQRMTTNRTKRSGRTRCDLPQN
jgi:hypothetical protein